MPWGQTIAYVADINGFLVELCTPDGLSTAQARHAFCYVFSSCSRTFHER